MRLASLLCAWMAAWPCRVRVRAYAVARLLVLGRGHISADECGRTRSGACARFSDWLEAGLSGAHAYDDQWEKQARAPDRGQTQSSVVVRVYVAQALRRPSAGARSSQHACSLSLSHLHVCAVYWRHIDRRFRAHALRPRTTKVHRLSWCWCCSAAGWSCLLVSTMSSLTAILYFSLMLLFRERTCCEVMISYMAIGEISIFVTHFCCLCLTLLFFSYAMRLLCRYERKLFIYTDIDAAL